MVFQDVTKVPMMSHDVLWCDTMVCHIIYGISQCLMMSNVYHHSIPHSIPHLTTFNTSFSHTLTTFNTSFSHTLTTFNTTFYHTLPDGIKCDRMWYRMMVDRGRVRYMKLSTDVVKYSLVT